MSYGKQCTQHKYTTKKALEEVSTLIGGEDCHWAHVVRYVNSFFIWFVSGVGPSCHR